MDDSLSIYFHGYVSSLRNSLLPRSPRTASPDLNPGAFDEVLQEESNDRAITRVIARSQILRRYYLFGGGRRKYDRPSLGRAQPSDNLVGDHTVPDTEDSVACLKILLTINLFFVMNSVT